MSETYGGYFVQTTGVIEPGMFIQGSPRNSGDPYCSYINDGYVVYHHPNDTKPASVAIPTRRAIRISGIVLKVSEARDNQSQ